LKIKISKNNLYQQVSEPKKLKGHQIIESLDVDPGGKTISGSRDKTIRIFGPKND